MQAVGFRQYGGVEVLETMQVLMPAPKQDEVLIRTIAAGVNPADWVIRSGALKLFARINMPFVPGLDVAGVIESAGSAVTRFKPGDAVYAMLPNLSAGGYAEYAAVAESSVARVPDSLTFAEAAAIPCAGLTALQGLRGKAGLQTGMRVLINGAAGGVGSFAVQIAKAMGAQVTGTASGRNLDWVRELGADHAVDYTQTDVTVGSSYDVVLDAVGVKPFADWKRALKPGGVIVTVNPIFGNPAAALLARVTGGGRKLRSLLVQPNGADLETLNGWVASGQLRPMIDRRYALSDAAEAHSYSETKRVRGKLVLVVDESRVDEKG